MKKEELMEYWAKEELTTYHYKVLLMLSTKEYMQSVLSKELGMARPNISRIFKTLEEKNLIYVSKEIGKNKYYAINKTPIKQIEGQVKMLYA